MLNWLEHLDRRWIFLAMALAVAGPILFQAEFPEKPTTLVENAFKAIEELPPGSRLLFAFDYDPASQGELAPMSAALVRHACERHHKLYFMTLWPLGSPIIQDNISIIEREYPGMKYGRDYVDLGYRAGNEGVIKVITTSLRQQYATDTNGTNLDDMPMTRDLKNVRDMNMLVCVGSGNPGIKEWVQYVGSAYDIPIVAGTTGVQTPQLYPYYPRQIVGLLGAIKGAAEYEQAVINQYPKFAAMPQTREGLRRMGPQLVAHLLMIGLIVLGNVIYFAGRRRSRA